MIAEGENRNSFNSCVDSGRFNAKFICVLETKHASGHSQEKKRHRSGQILDFIAKFIIFLSVTVLLNVLLAMS